MKRKIPIFKAEADIADQVMNDTAIAYSVELKPASAEINEKVLASFQAEASIEDLYPVQCILASTVWNANDDVFDPVETWAARYTPVDKPSNIEHNENKIVGHMNKSWAIDDDGKILADDLLASDLPEVFHVCAGSVIYLQWEDEATAKEVDDLVKDIKSGKEFVSMECLFPSFDYAVKDPEGKFHVVARNEKTAFLTKHLKRYGGKGEYEGNRIGRLMRNLTFSGKGYTKKPANKSSIIFNSEKLLKFSNASYENGVLLNRWQTVATQELKGDENMSEKLEAQIQKQEAEIQRLQDELSKANTAQYQKQIAELEDALKQAKESTDSVNTELDETKAKVDELTNKVKEVEDAKAEIEKSKAEVDEQLKKIEQEKITAERVSKLVEGGFDKEAAETKVKAFANLSDEQFDILSETLTTAMKKPDDKKDKKEDKEDKEDKSEAKEDEDTSEEVLESEASEKTEDDVDGAAAGEREGNESLETARKALAKTIARSMGQEIEEEEK